MDAITTGNAVVDIGVISLVIKAVYDIVKSRQQHKQRPECAKEFSVLHELISEKAREGHDAVLDGLRHRAELERRIAILEEQHSEKMRILEETRDDVKSLSKKMDDLFRAIYKRESDPHVSAGIVRGGG